ncbi:hypothetical protein BJ322DRAFT_410373 [Thelephora terrestris]|uniref:Uncharacterized protein n=1 Tax=Thelephora terrestris TaxID=56493 RepID=A0A9P6LBH9_9AGAM|nr:hypothetical protein BJ322DRAFT_410373 [Thelephora terrestris]
MKQSQSTCCGSIENPPMKSVDFKFGTSAAAPRVAGSCAPWLQYWPRWGSSSHTFAAESPCDHTTVCMCLDIGNSKASPGFCVVGWNSHGLRRSIVDCKQLSSSGSRSAYFFFRVTAANVVSRLFHATVKVKLGRCGAPEVFMFAQNLSELAYVGEPRPRTKAGKAEVDSNTCSSSRALVHLSALIDDLDGSGDESTADAYTRAGGSHTRSPKHLF